MEEMLDKVKNMNSLADLVQNQYNEFSINIHVYKGVGRPEVPLDHYDVYFQAKYLYTGGVLGNLPSDVYPAPLEDISSAIGELTVPPEAVDLYMINLGSV